MLIDWIYLRPGQESLKDLLGLSSGVRGVRVCLGVSRDVRRVRGVSGVSGVSGRPGSPWDRRPGVRPDPRDTPRDTCPRQHRDSPGHPETGLFCTFGAIVAVFISRSGR